MKRIPRPSEAADGPIRFAGYAAIFNWPDKGGDVVRAGAFRRTLERTCEVPLLWQHKGAPVGSIEHLSEDQRGLRVIARIADAETRKLVVQGLSGLSFGYRVRKARGGARSRELLELDLVEVSLVARPMQPRARVHAVET